VELTVMQIMWFTFWSVTI